MKKIIQTLKLRKFRSEVHPEMFDKFAGSEFVVLYDSGKWERVYFKDDLITILRNDHMNRITYVFDMVERIIIDRDIVIDIDKI